jgi:hypothetical protein
MIQNRLNCHFGKDLQESKISEWTEACFGKGVKREEICSGIVSYGENGRKFVKTSLQIENLGE